MELLVIILVECILILGFVAYNIYKDNKEKRVVLYGGREFNCYCTSEYRGHMCCVSIYEVIPNRKFFKEKYRAYKTFWIDDYETIKEGLYAIIEDYIQEEKDEEIVTKKWAELD